MQTSNGQRIKPGVRPDKTKKVDALNASKVPTILSSPQSNFIDFLLFHGVMDFVHSLRLVHDLALYHSDIPFDGQEKAALFDVKTLWEAFERLNEKN